jgi:hypothetical protein
MNTANKQISIVDVNNQLLAIRTAAVVPLAKVPQCEYFDIEEVIPEVTTFLKTNKCRTQNSVIQKAFNTLGFLCNYERKNKRVNGKQTPYYAMIVAPMP